MPWKEMVKGPGSRQGWSSTAPGATLLFLGCPIDTAAGALAPWLSGWVLADMTLQASWIGGGHILSPVGAAGIHRIPPLPLPGTALPLHPPLQVFH